MIEFFQGLAQDGISLVRQIGVLAAVGSVVLVWIMTRGQLAAILGTVFAAAVALWAISPAGLGWLDQRIEDTANKASFAPPPDGYLRARGPAAPVVAERADAGGLAGG